MKLEGIAPGTNLVTTSGDVVELLEVAAKGVAWGGFLNSGQVCTSLERVYVLDSIADSEERQLVVYTDRVGAARIEAAAPIALSRSLSDTFGETVVPVDLTGPDGWGVPDGMAELLVRLRTLVLVAGSSLQR